MLKLHNDILVVLIAHNELDCIKKNVMLLLDELRDTASEIVVVDNYSNDGLKDWLYAQNDVSYIICDDKLEGFGQILDIVKSQFTTGRDLLLLRANYFFTPYSIANMSTALYSKPEIAAVGPMCSLFAGEQKFPDIPTYKDTVRIQEDLKADIIKTAYLDPDVLLLKENTLEMLENNIEIPQAAIRAYMRNTLRQEFDFAVVKHAVCFAVYDTNDEPYREFQPNLYKQEKLHHLLYSFGDIMYKNVYLYKYLEPEILAGINNQNKYQNTKRNIGILRWFNDNISFSTNEQAEKTRQLITHLPQKDVLFVTMPVRREYHGCYIHTAIETFISSLDDHKYIDLEFVASENYLRHVPTKNLYPVQISTIPTIYGINETDKQELLEFLLLNYICPLEKTLDIKFPEDVLGHCILKASSLLKVRSGYIKFYKEVISHVKPKVIIYSHGQDNTLTYLRDAALELHVPTLEIDHGVGLVDTYHKNLVYADDMVMYSRICEKKCREQGNSRIFGIGKPGVYDNINEPDNSRDVIIILFISSLENEIVSYAQNLAKKLDKLNYLVIYKAHATELWEDKEKLQIEQELGNFKFMEGNIDIRDLVSLSDIVIGIRSSGIFDALPYYKVKVIAVKDNATNFSEAKPNEVLQEVVDNGDIIMVEDEDALYQEVLSYKRNVMYREKINSFWPADAKEAFRKLVDSYLS